MAGDSSVARLIHELGAGDEGAARRLWEQYFRRLVGLAHRRLRGAPRRLEDEEDVAVSAFASFWRAARLGRFPRLLDRAGLWRLLAVITVRKAAHLVRDEGRRPTHPFDAEKLPSHEPSPDLAAEALEEHRRLLGCLGDPELETVAVLRMENCSVEDIAAHLRYAPRTIKRKLALIRATWEGELLVRQGCRRGDEHSG